MAGAYHGYRLNMKELFGPENLGRTIRVKRFFFLLLCLRFDEKEARNHRVLTDRLSAVDRFLRNFFKTVKNITVWEIT